MILEKQQRIIKIAIIHTSDNILVIWKNCLLSIVRLILADMIITTPWEHYNVTEQQNEQLNEVKKQITNVIKRGRKKRALSEYCQIHNRNTKY